MTSRPVTPILAGPNGAGKTTVSPVFVRSDVEFVNADIIGAELRRENPQRRGADVTAGRFVSARLRTLAAERKSFCFETNPRRQVSSDESTPCGPMATRLG